MGSPRPSNDTALDLCGIRARNASVGTRPLLQMAPARRNEDRRVCVEGIPVGHAGDVVGDCALSPVALGDPLMLGREKLGVLLEMLEQFPEHALRFAVLR